MLFSSASPFFVILILIICSGSIFGDSSHLNHFSIILLYVSCADSLIIYNTLKVTTLSVVKNIYGN